MLSGKKINAKLVSLEEMHNFLNLALTKYKKECDSGLFAGVGKLFTQPGKVGKNRKSRFESMIENLNKFIQSQPDKNAIPLNIREEFFLRFYRFFINESDNSRLNMHLGDALIESLGIPNEFSLIDDVASQPIVKMIYVASIIAAKHPKEPHQDNEIELTLLKQQ